MSVLISLAKKAFIACCLIKDFLLIIYQEDASSIVLKVLVIDLLFSQEYVPLYLHKKADHNG